MNTASASASSSGGIGFVGALTVAFIVLKLTEVIGWSWWWVLSPIIIAGAAWLVILVIAALIVGIIFLKETR